MSSRDSQPQFERIASIVLRAILCAVSIVGCDFNIEDIDLDHAEPRTAPNRSMEEDGAPDTGVVPHEPPASGAGSTLHEAGLPPADATTPTAPAMQPQESEMPLQPDGGVSGSPMDASPMPTDAGDAQANADTGSPEDDADASVVDSGATLPGLCVLASTCVLVTFDIKGDYVRLTHGLIRVSDGDRSLEAEVIDGSKPQLWLPSGRSLVIHTTVEGFWDDEAMLVIPPGLPLYPMTAWVYSSALLETLCTPFGLSLDENKGFAIVDFMMNWPGAGMELGARSDPPIVEDQDKMLILSSTLVQGSGTLMIFPNVQPGALIPVAVTPPNFECRPLVQDLGYSLAPKTVVRMFANCEAVGP